VYNIYFARFDLNVDDVIVSGKFQDKMPRYIQTTTDMFLGGIPAGFMDTVRNREFDSVFLTSLKDGSIRDLTFEDKYVCLFVCLFVYLFIYLFIYIFKFSFSVKLNVQAVYVDWFKAKVKYFY